MRPVDASLINRAILDNAHRLSDERLEAWICALRDREETLVEELGIVRAGLQALDAEQWRRHAETLKEDNHGEEKENVTSEEEFDIPTMLYAVLLAKHIMEQRDGDLYKDGLRYRITGVTHETVAKKCKEVE